MPYTVAVDIGGTFTDLVAVERETGETLTAKVPSTPPDFVPGVADALRRVELGAVAQFRHATTIGTNAIIERAGARTGLITTRGFRDVLLAGRANKPDLYDSDWDPPPPLVPRRLIVTVRERMDHAGRVVTELDGEDVAAAARTLGEQHVEAVAICFLNSFMNPDHELRAKEIVERELPDAFVCTSAEVLPEIREFERTSTAVANAYLGPRMSRYLEALDEALRAGEGSVAQLDGELLVSHSGGGLMTVSSARELPARICQSGPAAGVMGAHAVTRRLGYDNAISLDMGGTSADIAAITAGRPAFRSEWSIAFNIPIIFPAVDLVTIGAGGGTIAWLDETGALHSGPMSAGAVPGPASYRRGGSEPTNTDANLVLGRLRPEQFLGGQMELDVEAAERAIADRVAGPLGMSLEEAAAGILRLSNAAMLSGIRLMTTQRGYDPREFSLIAFGGAGALQAPDLAREIGIERVVVPLLPGLMSARGILEVNVRHDLLEPLFQRGTSIDPERVRRAVEGLEAKARELKSRDTSVDAWHPEWRADVRYFGQISGYLTMPMPDGEPVAALEEVVRRFGEEHAREFGYELPPSVSEAEIVNLRTALVGEISRPPEPAFEPTAESGASEVAQVWFPGTGRVEAVCVDREGLAVGDRVEGPAIITEWDSTTVVPPGAVASVHSSGDLVLSLE